MSGELSESITELHTRQPKMRQRINQWEPLYQDLMLRVCGHIQTIHLILL